MLSRRTLLLASAGVGVLALAGWRGGAAMDGNALVRLVLKRHLGPFTMSEEELDRFVTAFAEKYDWLLPGQKLRVASNLSFDVGLHAAFRSVLPAEDEGEFDRFERRLLAEFHTLTDFPWRDEVEAPVRFVGGGACLNPFAKFD
jgi:hypothetical protein